MAMYLSRAGVDPMLLSWLGTAVAVGYAAYLSYSVSQKKDGAINQRIRKDEPKIVDTVDVEDLGNKSVFCRCWKSKKFPYCDGAHAAHNKECGDNVGPLIVQKREPQAT